jgi:GntR family transcriptional regulator
MTISKAYGLLESEGILERHRGKPMRVAALRRHQSSVAARLKQIEPQLEAVALAARQLELSSEEVLQALNSKLGEKP